MMAVVMLLGLIGPVRAQLAPTVPPYGFCLIPEMDYIPEMESWVSCHTSGGDYAQDLKRATEAWKKASEWAEKNITARTVTDLSRWAKKEMMNYTDVPPLGQIVWEPMTVNLRDKRLLFRSVVEILPPRSVLLERRLELYMLWDSELNLMIRLTVTIRGSRFE